MTEKVMQTLFGSFLKLYPPKETEVYELKITKNSSIPFSDLKEHQQEALLKASNKSLYHRITDQPWIPGRQYTFTLKKPFDCFVVVNVKAYVVIWYYKQRAKKVFIKIRIEDFIAEKEKSERKSLTEERAKEIGTPIFVEL